MVKEWIDRINDMETAPGSPAGGGDGPLGARLEVAPTAAAFPGGAGQLVSPT